MSTAMEDYHLQERELQKRLPHVSVEVIRHFLLQYQGNMDMCYEKLRPDPTTPNYVPYISVGGRTSTVSTSRPTMYHPRQNDQSHRQVRRTLTLDRHQWPHGPSAYGDVPSSVPPYSMTLPSHAMAPPTSMREPLTLPDGTAGDIVAAQAQQMEAIHKYQGDLITHLSYMKSLVDQKKHRLSELRIEVSGDVSEQQVGELKDVISTLHFDIQEARNKLQVHKVQTQMKHEQDLYTEEGVRWYCKECTFLNHPLMTQCEKCEVPKQRSYTT